MKLRSIVLLLITGLLISCAETPVKLTAPFDLTGRDYLYDKTDWFFSGRIAASDQNNSFSASINWKHQNKQDEIELAGPLGQGRTQIVLTKQKVVIDYGDERLQYFGNIDDVISKQLGVSVPVLALKYWVLGLVKPGTEYESFENGFLQSDWKVKYQKMQMVGVDELPKKIRVERNDTKLKLIIDDWQI
jgi:outer membrane lipoprotein LolB